MLERKASATKITVWHRQNKDIRHVGAWSGLLSLFSIIENDNTVLTR